MNVIFAIENLTEEQTELLETAIAEVANAEDVQSICINLEEASKKYGFNNVIGWTPQDAYSAEVQNYKVEYGGLYVTVEQPVPYEENEHMLFGYWDPSIMKVIIKGEVYATSDYQKDYFKLTMTSDNLIEIQNSGSQGAVVIILVPYYG